MLDVHSSRATSIGTATDRSSSAILFINLSRDRIEFLRGRKPDQPFKLIERRDEWNEHLHDSDPTNPDLFEIGKVTDYIISYACKGNMKTEVEVQVLNTLVQR